MLEPLAAMQAACIAVANGEAGEIEFVWDTELESLRLTVRRESWTVARVDGDDDGGAA